MKHFFKHIQSYILRGFFAMIPIFLCIFAVQLLYNLIDKRVMGLLKEFFDVRAIPGLGILLVLVSLYLIGLIVSNIIGRQLFHLIEGITVRIPILKTIYGVGKQISQSFAVGDDEKMALKKAVLVKLENANAWAPAFVTGEVFDEKTQEKMLVILIPTAPTPGSGFVVVVKPSQVIDPGWTIEECLKALISVGIITPPRIQNQTK